MRLDKMGTVRIYEDTDYDRLRQMVDSTQGWTEVYKKGHKRVAVMSNQNSTVQTVKATISMEDVTPETMFDVINDDEYRSTWDKHMTVSKDIAMLNVNNTISYYAIKGIPPLYPRDFVMQKSWLDAGNEKIICTHSVFHEDYAPQKGFVRGSIIVSGYIIRSKGERGTTITYLTHTDPGGKLPTWLVNKATKVMAPKVLDKLHKAGLAYESWKRTHRPHHKPWIFAEQMDLPRLDVSKCEPQVYDTVPIDESDIPGNESDYTDSN